MLSDFFLALILRCQLNSNGETLPFYFEATSNSLVLPESLFAASVLCCICIHKLLPHGASNTYDKHLVRLSHLLWRV